MIRQIIMPALLYVLLSGTIASAVAADDKALWLETFYENRGTCVATGAVPEISADQAAVYVDLAANNATLLKLGKISDNIVRDWLGLHCPIPFVAYSKVLQDHDIIVFSSTTPSVESLSCREFDQSLRR